MVKVLENRAIDLDIAPGNKQAEDLAAQARDAATSNNPTSDAQGVTANAKNAAAAVAGTLGGGVTGTLDTVGNTVGTLAGGLGGTVQGVGDGLGSAAQYTGGAVGSGIVGMGNMMGITGKTEKDGSAIGQDTVESTKQSLGEGVDKAGDTAGDVAESTKQTVGDGADKAGEVGQNALETSQKAASDAADKSSEFAGSVGEQTGLKKD